MLGEAREMIQAKETEAAIQQLELCLLYGPVNQLALLTRADLYEADGNTAMALADFRRALKLSPKNEALQRHVTLLEQQTAQPEPSSSSQQ